jgi:S-DNA-T family DNA segregation ATPase FtsK/SpoIIIE
MVWEDYRKVNKRKLNEPDEVPHSLEKLIQFLGFGLIVLGSMGIESLRLYSMKFSLPGVHGGVLGELLGNASSAAFGFTGSTLLLLLLIALGFSLYFHVSWWQIAENTGTLLESAFEFVRKKYTDHEDRKVGETAAVKRESTLVQGRAKIVEAPPIRIEPQVVTVQKSDRIEKERQTTLFDDIPDTNLPPLSLLDDAPVAQETVSIETLEFTSRLIEKKLSDFGVDAKVIAAYPGPVITRYEIEPATGVKGSQIVGLARDLARSFSLTSIRVVETIPGKNYMGLELPNPKRQIVRLTEILSSKVYNDSSSSLTIALGKDIAGHPVVADLAKMPHLLVAGTTGSGKSVGINATILSLLYKSDPNDVRMILIDPKMLEMSVYEGIPHLLAPVVTDMRQAGHALNWAVNEMERRYKLMSKLGVRNLAGYNVKIADAAKREEHIPNPFSLTPDAPEPLDKLPTIVIIIDELADLMMVVGKKVEELIARIAQKARAAGIHLILATQRPSVDVITGLIKANIPTRIAFQVSSKIDSRTILDQMGAESLLGMGDMLYMPPGTGLPVRVHGAFVSDEEVHRVVKHLKEQGEPNYIEGILEGGVLEEGAEGVAVGEGGGEADALYDQAVAIVLKNRRASISLVQRHLRIGYNRAARLLEQMETSGVVSTMQSNGNREILVPAGNSE